MKNGDFPSFFVCLPEASHRFCRACAAHPEAGLLSASDVEQEMRQCGVGALMEVWKSGGDKGNQEMAGDFMKNWLEPTQFWVILGNSVMSYSVCGLGVLRTVSGPVKVSVSCQAGAISESRSVQMARSLEGPVELSSLQGLGPLGCVAAFGCSSTDIVCASHSKSCICHDKCICWTGMSFRYVPLQAIISFFTILGWWWPTPKNLRNRQEPPPSFFFAALQADPYIALGGCSCEAVSCRVCQGGVTMLQNSTRFTIHRY